MKTYKIIGNVDGVLLSYTMGLHGVQYILNTPVSRREGCGPLAVFEDAKTAKKFSEDIIGVGRTEAYECTYTPSNDKGFWTDTQRRSDEVDAPKGTIYAESVTLLKQVNLIELCPPEELKEKK